MKISGIYQIRSKVKPARIYIGSAVNIHRRWHIHIYNLRHNTHHSKKLQNHFNKYGKNDLVFSVIIGCDKEDLLSTEQYFLDSYKPFFNCSMTAIGCPHGIKPSKEARKKISDGNKGIRHFGSSNPFYGRHHSEETKRKLSEALSGRPLSVETRLKMSKSQKGKKYSEETKQKLREINKGKKLSEEHVRKIREVKSNISAETRKKMSEAAKHRSPISEETRRKISKAGKCKSEATRRKQSEAMKGNRYGVRIERQTVPDYTLN